MPIAVGTDPLPVEDITLGVTAAVDKINEILDTANAPTNVIAGGNVQQLTTEGRIMALAEQRDLAVNQAASVVLAQPDPDALVKAKVLLSESFKWLGGFTQTADLRQRITMFMEGKS